MQQTIIKKDKTRYDWLGKAIHLELYKRLKLNHTTKWYNQLQKFILENKTQSSLRFQDTNRRPNPDKKTRLGELITKQTKGERICRTVNFAVPADYKIKRKPKDRKILA